MKQANGFSLVELMVALVILAITLAFGVPQINNLVMNNRKVDALNRFSANLSYARSEAIKRATPISVRPNTVDSWHDGWTVFIDSNNDGNIDPGETLRVEDDLNIPDTVTITCNACGDIVYNADGSVSGVANITISLTDSKLSTQTDLTITPIGRIGIEKIK